MSGHSVRGTATGRPRSRFRSRAGVLAAVVLTAAALLTGASPASAAPVTDCTPWGTTELRGGEYLYQQNEWNSETMQCVDVDPGTGAWSVTTSSFSLPTNGAPATYPSSYKGCHWGLCTADSGLPLRVDELGSVRTDWSTTQVGSGAYNVSMDIWFNSAPVTDDQPDGTELMIWMNHRGGVQPIGSRTATVQLDGRTWDVWTGPGASGWKVISYVLQNGATELTDFNVKALIDDGAGRGSISRAHYLIDAEAGFEIWQGGQGLGMKEFSFAASTEPESGGSDTQAPTVPTDVAVTGTTQSTVSLSWTPATDDTAVSGYDVYRDGAKAGTTASASFTDTGLTASSSHSYTVRARDAAGNTSAHSAQVTATTAAGGGGQAGALRAQYKNNDASPGDNQIRPGLQLVNTAATAVDLSKVSVRYWFSGESGAASYGTACDYAVIGCGTVTHRVRPSGSPGPGADHYLEVGFTGGSLAAGASTGEIQLRLNKADWSAFDESDDYSRAVNTVFADAPKVAVYVNGVLTSGTAP
ncbi:GH12 family glycosyl hydrolase domain-containing protein [Streptomyces laculatispora]|uniref:GH12 family glycosyl hydrolase domain-containing protein n=1 Tax=Streptomyces laculatispora TaxID=887464 RepID=UPI00351364E0